MHILILNKWLKFEYIKKTDTPTTFMIHSFCIHLQEPPCLT